MRKGLWGVCLVVGLALAACASLPPLPPPVEQPVSLDLVRQRAQLATAAYTLGPEDVIRIVVFDHADLSQEVTIGPDGSFAYPLLGQVRAAGLTARQLEEELTRRLADGYLVNPQVTVSVAQYRKRHVYVLGEVRSPGVYPLRHGATVLELLSQAGGPTPEAGWSVLVVRAAGQNGTAAAAASAVMRLDLERLMAGESAAPVLLASGDTLYVPPRGHFFVTGEVARPGRYPLERDMTVLQGVILAGGFTRFAAKKGLRVRRLIEGQPQEFRARLHDFLADGDVLIVPQSVF